MNSKKSIELEDKYGANNYHPLDVVISKAKGSWVWDCEGNKYLDYLSAYSAINHGHLHPEIIKIMIEQGKRLTLTSRAFRNDQLGQFYEKICEATGYDMFLPMNTGAEAVETALKTVRKWGEKVKGVEKNKGEIIACEGNFHGRTISIISMSSEEQYRDGFGPFTPGLNTIPYGDAEALKDAINENTVGFLVEPIQCEGGILIPSKGYLKKAYEICKENNVAFMADEIQTGLGRTGKLFCCDYEDVKPDIMIVGKALGGGVFPVSGVLASKEYLGVFNPGDHGSTFGGNPLGAAIAKRSIEVLLEEKLVEKSAKKGEYLLGRLKKIESPNVKEIRGMGLMIGIEMKMDAREFCEVLAEKGILAHETHKYVVRLAPPLNISKKDIDWSIPIIEEVLKMDF